MEEAWLLLIHKWNSTLAELEQLRVNVQGMDQLSKLLEYRIICGTGYRSGNHYWLRYNVLTDKNNIYGSAFMFLFVLF
jgi:hypothetical protein